MKGLETDCLPATKNTLIRYKFYIIYWSAIAKKMTNSINVSKIYYLQITFETCFNFVSKPGNLFGLNILLKQLNE